MGADIAMADVIALFGMSVLVICVVVTLLVLPVSAITRCVLWHPMDTGTYVVIGFIDDRLPALQDEVCRLVTTARGIIVLRYERQCQRCGIKEYFTVDGKFRRIE